MSMNGTLVLLVGLASVLVVVAGTWKVFEKAGEPGWASLIPIYNTYVMLKIGNNPWWYLLLLLVPIVNIYFTYKMFADISRSFGQGIGFGFGLWLLGIIFWPLLGFGDYQYRSTVA